MLEIFEKAVRNNGLVGAFAFIGVVVLLSGFLSRKLTFGRIHGSAIAILIGLVLAYWGVWLLAVKMVWPMYRYLPA